jgi:acyl-CoA reductase-like NAD-dependent aldehyde dehydrogenase
MSERLATISPIDGRIYVERELADANAINRALDTARRSQAAWQSLPL